MSEKEAAKPSVRQILETLEYGPAPESPAVANAWLDDHGRSFGHFINNAWVKPSGRKTYDSVNPATGEKMATTIQGACVRTYIHMYTCGGWNWDEEGNFNNISTILFPYQIYMLLCETFSCVALLLNMQFDVCVIFSPCTQAPKRMWSWPWMQLARRLRAGASYRATSEPGTSTP